MVNCTDSENKFAEVEVVLFGEDVVEDAGSKAIDVEEQLPCLVTT